MHAIHAEGERLDPGAQSVRFGPSLLREIRRVAENRGVSVSKLCRLVMSEFCGSRQRPRATRGAEREQFVNPADQIDLSIEREMEKFEEVLK